MKRIMESIAISIGISLTIFAIVGIVFDVIFKGNFSIQNYGFTKMVLGCIVCGCGFGVPSIVYENDKIPLPIQCIVHMGIGCIVYTAVAFIVGWIPVKYGILPCVLSLLGELMAAFLIWLGFLKYYRNLADKMNRKIQEMK